MKKQVGYKELIEPPAPEEIKDLRIASGLTQDELAALVGLSGGIAISKYEQGNRRPSVQIWTLMLLFIGQHPTLQITVKPKADDHQSSKPNKP